MFPPWLSVQGSDGVELVDMSSSGWLANKTMWRFLVASRCHCRRRRPLRRQIVSGGYCMTSNLSMLPVPPRPSTAGWARTSSATSTRGCHVAGRRPAWCVVLARAAQPSVVSERFVSVPGSRQLHTIMMAQLGSPNRPEHRCRPRRACQFVRGARTWSRPCRSGCSPMHRT